MNRLKSNQELLEPIIFFDNPPKDYVKYVDKNQGKESNIFGLVKETIRRIKSIELNYNFPRDLNIKTSFKEDYYGRNYQF